jgi:hypothetical protein
VLSFLYLPVPESGPRHDRTIYKAAERKLFTFCNVASGNGIDEGNNAETEEKK